MAAGEAGMAGAKPELAPYAACAAESRGRLYPEPESPTRSAFQRDRDRIIHSAAFRRLKHKTQVFVYHEGDYYRTRLTHSIEVAQIARSLARVLRLDEDLAEALALAHDLGHTPFGHAGEDALDECLRPFGGFDHNAQALKIVTALEARYASFDGLNLTWEALEGLVKHNGPLATEARPESALPEAIRAYNTRQDLELSTFASLEAQVAALADDIAYNNHDIDDGLRAELFTVDALMDVPLAGQVFAEVLARYPGLERPRLIHESIRRLINRMCDDVIGETRRRLARCEPRSAHDVRHAGIAIAAFSEPMQAHDKALKGFLFPNMYRHSRVQEMIAQAHKAVRALFDLYTNDPQYMPIEWAQSCGPAGSAKTAQVTGDYIAGMTDRFALQEYSRHFGIDLMHGPRAIR